MNQTIPPIREKIFGYLVFALRAYLVFYMINYGWSKIMMSQFGVSDPAILEKPMKEVNSFYVAWHLYARSVFFNITTGLMEVIGAILLIFNRTVLLGALLVLTVLGQIFIIDVAFTSPSMGFGLSVRIVGMMISALLILFYHKTEMTKAIKSLTNNVSTKFQLKWWQYLILIIIGFLMDFVWAIIMMPLTMLLNWMQRIL